LGGVFPAAGAGGVKQTSAYTELLDTVRLLFRQYFDVLRKIFRAHVGSVASGAPRLVFMKGVDPSVWFSEYYLYSLVEASLLEGSPREGGVFPQYFDVLRKIFRAHVGSVASGAPRLDPSRRSSRDSSLLKSSTRIFSRVLDKTGGLLRLPTSVHGLNPSPWVPLCQVWPTLAAPPRRRSRR
jgi:hypothetical protein